MKRWCFIMFFLLCGNFSFAQHINLSFQHLNITDGLSNNRVRCILQDTRGFMWFGTDVGLNRFDGKEFIVFKNVPGDSTSVSGNEIRDLFEDREGLIWIATGDGGLTSYDYRKGNFTQYHIILTGNDASLANTINAIAERDQKRLWIATEKAGLHSFDKGTVTFQSLSQTISMQNPEQSNKAYSYFDVSTDSKGTTYFGTLAYSLQVLRNGNLLSTSQINYPYPANTINCIFIDGKNRVWLGAWDNALHEYNPETHSISTMLLKKTEPLTYSGDEIISINEDKRGLLWIGTRRNGLYLFNPDTKEIFNFKKTQTDAASLSSSTIRCIYHDSQNRMWLGTDAGLDVFDPLLHQFELVSLRDIIPDAADEEMVYDFMQDGNTFYVATGKGLLIRRGTDEKFVRKTFSYNGEPVSITKIFKDQQNQIYLGTNKTVFVFNPQNETIKTFNCFFRRKEDQFNFFNIPSSRIVNMAEGNWNGHDVLWVCPYGHGVGVFDKKTLSGLVSTLNIPDNMENLVRKVFIDSKGNCWLLCTTKGIGRGISSPVTGKIDGLWSKENFPSQTLLLDSAFLQTEFVTHTQADSFSLLSHDVFDMLENKNGTYWVTTHGGGLYLFNPAEDKRTFTAFPSDHPDMEGITQDANENLWMIASGGIEFFDVRKKRFHHFGATDGIPNEGVHGYFYRDKEGFAYAAGNGFYLRFRPEDIQFNQSPPKVSLTHFSIFDQPADELLLQKEISLSYKQNFFSFQFAALNFTDGDQNEYAYMLEGVDKDWVQSGNRNFASYTKLPGGHFVFRVKAANNHGIWNEEGISIPVYIRPPLWQYAWFYPSLILLLIAGGYIFYRSRVKQIHRRQEEKLRAEIEAQEHERVRIAQDLHDDFGTRISALKIYMSTLEKYLDSGIEEVKTVKESAKNMVNEAMTDLRSLLMNLSPKTLEMHGYYAAVHDLVNRLIHTKMFEVELDVDASLQRFDKKYELALYRITQELLNNSIKHAQCTEIAIQLLKRDNEIVLSYADNGKGFSKSSLQDKGFGLKNIENRISLLNGKIIWDTNPGMGLNVMIEIPYSSGA